MSAVSIKRLGFVDDDSGYSGAFSWWRSNSDRWFWYVCGHGAFANSGAAVTDDFGNLVEVHK